MGLATMQAMEMALEQRSNIFWQWNCLDLAIDAEGKRMRHCAALANKDHRDRTAHQENQERMEHLEMDQEHRALLERMPSCTTECYRFLLNVHVKHRPARWDHRGHRAATANLDCRAKMARMDNPEDKDLLVHLDHRVKQARQDNVGHPVNLEYSFLVKSLRQDRLDNPEDRDHPEHLENLARPAKMATMDRLVL